MSTTYYDPMPEDVTLRRDGDALVIQRGEERVVCTGDLGLLAEVLRHYPEQVARQSGGAPHITGGGRLPDDAIVISEYAEVMTMGDLRQMRRDLEAERARKLGRGGE